MTEQTDIKARATIYRKIAAIAAAIQPVKPTGYNQDTKKKYADADDITAALKPLLGEHQLSITMHISQARREDTGQRTGSGTPYILTMLDCVFIIADGETGEQVICPWSAEAADHMKDKGIPKALTIARRTFLIHTFQIIAEEEKQLYGGQQDEQRPAQAPRQPIAQRPQAPAPTNGKTPPTRADLEAALGNRISEAKALGIEVKDADAAGKTDQQLINAGQRLRAAIDQAKRKAAMHEEANLPL